MKKKNWYLIENGKCVIELKTDRFEQLFDNRDPNPFRIRDLDDDVEEYIVSSATEIGIKRLGKLRIFITEKDQLVLPESIINAVHEYFLYRSDIVIKKVRRKLKVGIKSLLIGFLFLALAISSSSFLREIFEGHYLTKFFEEGLLVVGWVSMWMPVNIFLYEWWPLLDDYKLYVKLSTIEIEVLA
jgi:hypothetical protein